MSKRQRCDSSKEEEEGYTTALSPKEVRQYLKEELLEISNRRRRIIISKEKTFCPKELDEYVGRRGLNKAREFIQRYEGVFTMQPYIYYT